MAAQVTATAEHAGEPRRQLLLPDAEATEALGAALWRLAPERLLVFLHGELGAGKTTFARGLLRAGGYLGAVRSPTYALVEEYELGERRVFHFDLYRLSDPEELLWLGIEDYLRQPALCMIEWPEMGAGLLPAPNLTLRLSHHAGQRLLQWRAENPELEKTLHRHWKI